MVVKLVNQNKLLLIIFVIALALIIGIEAVIIVNNNHQQKLYNSAVAKINEKALACYRAKICQDSTITLKELYDYKYLKTMANPKTKEIFNPDSYVVIVNNKTKFTLVE